MIVLLSRDCLRKSFSMVLDGKRLSVRNSRSQLTKITYARGEGYVKVVRVRTRGEGVEFRQVWCVRT